MVPTDVIPREPATLRRGEARADHEPIVDTASLVTSRVHCPALGCPAATGAATAGTPAHPGNWRQRIASAARARPARQRANGCGPPRLGSVAGTYQVDRVSRSRDITRAGAAGAGHTALDSSRLRVLRGLQGQAWHGPDAARLTKRQLQFIHALARECDVEPAELEWHSRRLFGAGTATLSRDGAKMLIDRLARALDAVA